MGDLKYFLSLYLLLVLLAGCTASGSKERPPPQPDPPPASLGIIGDEDDVDTETMGGIVLMGGSTDVDKAMAWMIGQSGGGDFVVIRATGTDAYNPYIFRMGGANSVETLKINSISLANDSSVTQKIRNAEALFIAGGDQSDYVRFWKDTKTEAAINYLMNEKKAPVGGTSAGCAILGDISFSVLNGSITSEEALKNPFHSNLSLQRGNFLQAYFLKNTITDQHYLARNREGRHITFMARIADEINAVVQGIGVDERTAVAIDSSGRATVFGKSSVTFLRQTNVAGNPEVLSEDDPLTWNQNNRAVTGYRFTETSDGQPQFDIKEWIPVNKTEHFYYYIERGELKMVVDP